MPAGWINAVDEDGADRTLLVFESQLEGYKALREHKEMLASSSGCTPQQILETCFSGFGLQPRAEEIEILMSHYRLTGEFPHIFPLSGRKSIDPTLVAAQCKAQNVGVADLEAKLAALYQAHRDMIDCLYGSFEAYRGVVFDHLSGRASAVPLGLKIEEIPDETIDFTYGGYYDLQELTEEVKAEMFGESDAFEIPVAWTPRPYKSYYGQYRCLEEENPIVRDRILINCMLDSEKISREAVKYVIYHELLHRENHTHNKAFREKEHLYPNWTELERELDRVYRRFEITEK